MLGHFQKSCRIFEVTPHVFIFHRKVSINMDISTICEAIMMICFGASWPAQIVKTIRVKNPVGSFLFLSLILCGYIAGVIFKLTPGRRDAVIWLYIINALMVLTDMLLSIHYLAVLKKKQQQEQK